MDTPVADLKSLAHPDWPYTGTAHEWRGFVRFRGEVVVDRPYKLTDTIETVLPDWQSFVYQKQNFGPELT